MDLARLKCRRVPGRGSDVANRKQDPIVAGGIAANLDNLVPCVFVFVQTNMTVVLQAHTPDTVSKYLNEEERCNSV